MERILILAYGNPLRSDDGVAWRAAEELRKELSTAKVICVPQLAPELAEDVALADLVIFLDAASDGEPGRMDCEVVSAESSRLHFSHHLVPGEILALSHRLYSAKPSAFLISIHGECFDHGQKISPAAMRSLPQVLEQVGKLMTGRIENLERSSCNH